MMLYLLPLFVSSFVVVLAGRPEVKCPVPISPINGQIFITRAGTAVKYTCNPGYELKGSQLGMCKNGQWYPEIPSCEPTQTNAEDPAIPASSTTPRPLFKWDEEQNDTKDENNTIQGDDSRVVYVRRWPYYYYRAPLHASLTEEEVAQAREDAIRHNYYWNTQYPRSALVDYRNQGLSESQWAWINSLHPETREKYLKDLHKTGVLDPNYLNYVNNYHWTDPYYPRQALEVIPQTHVSTLDYSCHRTERDGRVITIKAPKLRYAYIHRYDRRQNPNYPRNDYLAAEYRCKAGFTLLNPKVNELYCSRSNWVGNQPVCVPTIKRFV